MNIKAISSKLKGNPTMVEGTVYSMLVICSISHFLNDMIQSIIPAIYPIMKDKFNYSFAQIGIITLVFQMTSSILQPFTGFYADKHPRPYALSVGMCFTLIGLLLLAFAENYFIILLAVSVVGFGSSIFTLLLRLSHNWPREAKRVWLSPYFRWEAMAVRLLARYLLPSLFCPSDIMPSLGLLWRHC